MISATSTGEPTDVWSAPQLVWLSGNDRIAAVSPEGAVTTRDLEPVSAAPVPSGVG